MTDRPYLSAGAEFLRRYPVHGSWLRWMFKAPLVLWRMGLGFLIGRYIMVITTTGRKSGLPRHTMAEWHPLTSGGKFVPVNYGERAQWYRNIVADPHVTIQTSDGAEHVLARRITGDDELLDAYRGMKAVNPVMTDWYLDANGIEAGEPDLLANKDRVYIITFDPTDEPTPPPLEADLLWLWTVIGMLLVLLRRSGKRRG